MSAELSHREFLLALTADAVMQARIARDQLHEVIIPALPPQRRALAEAVKRQLHADALLTKPFLRDLEILIDFMRVEIEKGIQTTWIADEHNVHGGHHERHFDTRSHSLAVAVGHLIGMYEAATEVIDFAEAERLIEDLLQ
ncbi:hypothetical protein [Yoonia maritima]|uniref:hypothetical protein n=1 Tax=Yoonia maritima TaxID=1435347 RepID=UPI000D104FDB|nr:hypothetical protein [Yoonia maritima]